MAWEAVATIVALLGVLVTFVFNIRSNRLTRRSVDQDRELAREAMAQDREIHEATARRSEAAARLTETYTQRIVDALERIADRPRVGATSFGAAATAARWKLEHDQGDRYRLQNVGGAVAKAVHVSADDTLPVSHIQGRPDLRPGEALTFMATRTMATTDSTVTVTWMAGDHEEQIWQYPLPPRP